MRYWISGIIGVVWGGLLILARLLGGPPQGSGSYVAGQWAGTVFGVVLFVVGVHYIRKALAAKKRPSA